MPPAPTVGWVTLSFVVLSINGALLSVSPPLFRLPLAAVAGLFNAWAWFGIVHAVAGRPAPRFIPLAPAGLVAVVIVVVGGAAIGFETVTSRARLSHATTNRIRIAGPETGKPVLIVSGFGTHWDGDASRRLPGAFDERRFSYRGVDGDGGPLPYAENDTHRSLVDLARAMGSQVDAFHAATGRPVSLVAESEGSLVPAVHGGLLSSGAVHKTIGLRLDGGKLPQYDIWSSVERVVRVASSAWQVPPLPLSINPAWGHPPGRAPTCASIAPVLQRWVGGSGPG